MNVIDEINSEGFTIIENVYSADEIDKLISNIENVGIQNQHKNTYRKSDDLFAVRQFFNEFPQALEIVFNSSLKQIIKTNFGDNYFVTKSIYFDKPEKSNWFVSYHQDLTISVNQKLELDGFENWTVKQNQFAVQPPENILKNCFTIRIHLDNTSKENGALKVINKSHSKGIVRLDNFTSKTGNESICEVEKGGIMIMKPLLFHASNKTTNNERRRVIHIEFCNQQLPNGLNWNEKVEFNLN
ncbi:phytanoyl-CoA dioxygenase [Flavobacterium magnum]|uniref:Phytanoyl-CoA dioxygenase n=1 Tax=Flavobacterium magnum TaxID=2162713 RepID=A0A2S0RH46_9FLAO|nr:phytanoyl-CoA dioxygenase family protein [Flavobacterium magnum]AWA30935.1 phytanoyl-CoA dioxygenase [Flavobacterium magnum]